MSASEKNYSRLAKAVKRVPRHFGTELGTPKPAVFAFETLAALMCCHSSALNRSSPSAAVALQLRAALLQNMRSQPFHTHDRLR